MSEENLITAAEAQALLDHPYVACCGDCGTRLHCALGYDPDHTGTHARVQQDVHKLARTVVALAEKRDRAVEAYDGEVSGHDATRARLDETDRDVDETEARVAAERARADKAEGAAEVLRRELVHARQMSGGVAEQAREAIERAEKAEAESARFLAITEGRITPPTDEELGVHWRAGGIWFVTSPVWHESIRGFRKAQSYAEDHRENNEQWTWVAADRSGRPCAWPVVDGEVVPHG